MKEKNKVRGAVRKIKRLFRATNTNVTIQKHPEEYYKHVWIEQSDYEAVDLLAKENGASKKQMFHDLLDVGMGDYFAARIREQNRQVAELRERGEPARPTYFTIKLRQWAREKGYEISDFI